MTTLHQPIPSAPHAPFVIYEDMEDRMPQTPEDNYMRNVSFVSGSALPLGDTPPHTEPEQDLDDGPLPYKSSYTSRKSAPKPRRSSAATQYSLVSAIPSETSTLAKAFTPGSPVVDARYAPQKERPRFRNPESVRAMQMSSPPPMLDSDPSRERTKGTYKLATPSRSGRSETPVSRPSGSRRGSIRELQSPRSTPAPHQAPLVLLHVTILPIQVPFSHHLMVKVMPRLLVENYKLLEDKLQDIILMRRGLLIPHPRDEYDLLEERILESLELKTPRVLKCGHFVAPEDSDKEDDSDSASSSSADESPRQVRRMSGGTLTEGDHLCTDCHGELKRPGKGLGSGTRKWDIKIYAANGLMRSAAWTACWNDMERCDVEISPWIPEGVRKTLERRVQEEKEAEKQKQMYAVELQRHIQDAAAKQRLLEDAAATSMRLEETKSQQHFQTVAAALEQQMAEERVARARVEAGLEERLESTKQSIRHELESRAEASIEAISGRLQVLETALLASAPRHEDAASSRRRAPAKSSCTPITDIPLSTLIKNYVVLLLGDQRNLVILLLSIVVIFLSFHVQLTRTNQVVSPRSHQASHDGVAWTPGSTATTTAVSFSTSTVTQVHTATVTPDAPGLVFQPAAAREQKRVAIGATSLHHKAVCERPNVLQPHLACER